MDSSEDPNRRIVHHDAEDLELVILRTFVLVAVEALDVIEKEESTLLQDHIREQRRLCRSLPAEKIRPTWAAFCSRVSDTHFRKQFRMTCNSFTNLCKILSRAIGEATFRPENSLPATRNSASLQNRSGLIPGEVKVAISL